MTSGKKETLPIAAPNGRLLEGSSSRFKGERWLRDDRACRSIRAAAAQGREASALGCHTRRSGRRSLCVDHARVRAKRREPIPIPGPRLRSHQRGSRPKIPSVAIRPPEPDLRLLRTIVHACHPKASPHARARAENPLCRVPPVGGRRPRFDDRRWAWSGLSTAVALHRLHASSTVVLVAIPPAARARSEGAKPRRSDPPCTGTIPDRHEPVTGERKISIKGEEATRAP